MVKQLDEISPKSWVFFFLHLWMSGGLKPRCYHGSILVEEFPQVVWRVRLLLDESFWL